MGAHSTCFFYHYYFTLLLRSQLVFIVIIFSTFTIALIIVRTRKKDKRGGQKEDHRCASNDLRPIDASTSRGSQSFATKKKAKNKKKFLCNSLTEIN